MNNKQDPRYFKYSPFPKRQCAVTGATDASGAATFLGAIGNTMLISAGASYPLVVTFANGFDPFPVDYAYKWSSGLIAPSGWDSFSNAIHYLYIDYDPDTDTVSYGSTTVVPNDDPIAPSHGPGVHWFDVSKYKMYESVSSSWVERIRVFVGECNSNGTAIVTVTTYALNGRWYSGEKTIQALNTVATFDSNIGSDKVLRNVQLICKTSEGIAVAGQTYDCIERYYDGAGGDFYDLGLYGDRLKFNHRRGQSNTLFLAAASGLVGTSTNFRYIFSSERSY